ncbi:TA system antitoxin ParD family protein [Parasphingorhabdus sp.]|uniref:TA system antitoxin ParD family protein n=1 Tax=Parasphingorhabdus sp. TaxID=2709688 RepID=UPI003002F047
MAKTVKIDDELMEVIGREAEMMSRSLAGQVRHWVRIGMSVEKSRFFDQARVVEALSGQLAPDALTAGEQEAHIDGLFEAARSGTVEQGKLFAERKGKGLGIGLRGGRISKEGDQAA